MPFLGRVERQSIETARDHVLARKARVIHQAALPLAWMGFLVGQEQREGLGEGPRLPLGAELQGHR